MRRMFDCESEDAPHISRYSLKQSSLHAQNGLFSCEKPVSFPINFIGVAVRGYGNLGNGSQNDRVERLLILVNGSVSIPRHPISQPYLNTGNLKSVPGERT